MLSNAVNTVNEDIDLLRAVVVEDEVGPLETIVKELNNSGNFEVVGSIDSVKSGIELILNTPCDVIFLDIKLKGGYCTDLINGLRKRDAPIPPIVITTGHIDYLMCRKLINDFSDCIIYVMHKPFGAEWITHRERIIDKILFYHQQTRMRAAKAYDSPVSQFQIRFGTQILFLNPADVVMVKVPEITGTGTSEIILEHSIIPIPLSLTQTAEQLPDHFVQVTRGCFVNRLWISAVGLPEITMRTGAKIYIGTTYKDSVIQALGL